MDLGSRDNLVYFLLHGEVVLEPVLGKPLRIAAGTEPAQRAIAPVQPRQFRVSAGVDGTCLGVIEQPLLARLIKEAPTQDGASERKPDQDPHNPSYGLLMQFHRDLKANQINLPSLPDAAIRVRKVAEAENSSMGDIARVVRHDPAMVVKLVRAANSPFYRGWARIESCEEAVVRLGIEATRQLVTVFAMRELFQTRTASLKTRMTQLWDNSREVAAIAYVLAKMTPRLNPEHALLAGLIHAVGAIPVIHYAQESVSLIKYPEILEEVILDLQAELGAALLQRWEFPQDLIDVVVHAGNFMYDSGSDEPDYVDVILVAQLHAAIGKPGAVEMPAMERVPAVRKLARGELTAERSLAVLAQAQEELREARQMLGAA